MIQAGSQIEAGCTTWYQLTRYDADSDVVCSESVV